MNTVRVQACEITQACYSTDLEFLFVNNSKQTCVALYFKMCDVWWNNLHQCLFGLKNEQETDNQTKQNR